MISAMNGSEVVFYCTHESPTMSENDYINRAINALTAAKKANCKRFVVLSTAEVVQGNVPHASIVVDETLPIYPELINGLYGRAMAKVEQIVLERGAMVSSETGKGTEVVVVRPPWVWGIGDPRMKMIGAAVRAKTFTWINSGAYLYSYCYLSNVIEGLILAAQNGENGEIYFLTDAYPIQFKEFVTRLLATQNIDCSNISSVAPWLGHAVSWFQRTSGVSLSYSDIALSTALNQVLLISDKKARRLIGYKGQVGFEKGLDEIREHYIFQLKTPRSTTIKHL